MQLRATLAALGLAALVGGCKPTTAATESEESVTGGAREREIPKVRVASLEQREMVQVLETTSVLESETEIQVFPRTAGVITEIAREEGDRVMAGDTLASIDDRDLKLAVRDAEVALEEARQSQREAQLRVEEAAARVQGAKLSADQATRDYDRDLRLFEGEIASALSQKALEASLLARDNAVSEHQQAEIALRLAELTSDSSATAVARAAVALERAQLNLSYAAIAAPFDGVVAERMTRVGNSVSTGEAVYVLTDTHRLRAVFFRPQEELELFRRGPGEVASSKLAFSATAESYPGREFRGEIERISPTINAESGQFRVTARIEPASLDGQARLLPGMLVRMRIVTDRHPEAQVVPKRALRREGESLYVLVVEEGEDGSLSVRRVDVEEGYSDDDHVEILPEEGTFAAGTQVVSVGSRDLGDGDPIEIERPAGTAPDEPSEPAGETATEPAEATQGD